MKGGFFAGLAIGALVGAIILEAKPETMNIIKECKSNMMKKSNVDESNEPKQ